LRLGQERDLRLGPPVSRAAIHPEWEVTYPVVTVHATGYPDHDVDCGFPDL
jgi:hypothetical protein